MWRPLARARCQDSLDAMRHCSGKTGCASDPCNSGPCPLRALPWQRSWTYDQAGEAFNDKVGRLLAPTVQLKASLQPGAAWTLASAAGAAAAHPDVCSLAQTASSNTQHAAKASPADGPPAGYVWVR